MSVRRWSRGAVLAVLACVLVVLASCESRPARTPHVVPAPLSDELLALPDSATQWVTAPRPAPDSTALRMIVLWDATDPACLAAMPAIEAWHEAYSRFGLRMVGAHFSNCAACAESAAVASAARRLGVRFASAVSAEPPPASLAAGHGPVVWLGDRGDARPLWPGEPDDARRIEARLRAAIEARHPEARFPADAGGDPSGDAPAPRWRRVSLAPGEARGPLARAKLDESQPFTAQFRFQQEGSIEVPLPIGWWTPRRDGLEAARGGAANFVAIRYDAARVGVVMSPPAGSAARVWVLQDERWIPAGEEGGDVRFDERGASYVEVGEPRLYWIARGKHVLKLSPDVPGTRFHAFLFEAAQPRP
jgi:hypothetical protein